MILSKSFTNLVFLKTFLASFNNSEEWISCFCERCVNINEEHFDFFAIVAACFVVR